MAESIILIAKPERMAALRQRLSANGDALVFADAEALKALRAIVERQPKVVALDPAFAATPRGAALLARMRADAALATIDVRVLGEDGADEPPLVAGPAAAIDAAIVTTARPLEGFSTGTRRAPRFVMKPDTTALVNGETSRLINLSVTGAQVVSPVRLQPNQGIRFVLLDGDRPARLRANIAWSSVEPLGATLTYRAGLEFADADADAGQLEAYCQRCGTQPLPARATS